MFGRKIGTIFTKHDTLHWQYYVILGSFISFLIIVCLLFRRNDVVMDDLEKAFQTLKKEGRNNVNNLVKLMKDSKLIDGAKETEEKVIEHFSDAGDKANIELRKFKKVVEEVKASQTSTFTDVLARVNKTGSAIVFAAKEGARAAAKAFREAMNDKKK